MHAVTRMPICALRPSPAPGPQPHVLYPLPPVHPSLSPAPACCPLPYPLLLLSPASVARTAQPLPCRPAGSLSSPSDPASAEAAGGGDCGGGPDALLSHLLAPTQRDLYRTEGMSRRLEVLREALQRVGVSDVGGCASVAGCVGGGVRARDGPHGVAQGLGGLRAALQRAGDSRRGEGAWRRACGSRGGSSGEWAVCTRSHVRAWVAPLPCWAHLQVTRLARRTCSAVAYYCTSCTA